MNELMMFDYESKEIRTILIDGELWFVGKDVTEVLGYLNHSKALIDHVDDEDKLNNESLSSLGQRGGWLINESGLYSLVISSKLPNAKQFKRWITKEVLPSIRKNGGYINNQENLTPEEIVANAVVVAQKIIENQKKQIEELKPKADYADKLLKTKDNILVREFAKVLCDEGLIIGEKKLYHYLRENNFLMKNNEPYQRYLDNKTFIVEVRVIETPFGEKQTRTTKITPTGQLFLFKKISEYKNGIQV